MNMSALRLTLAIGSAALLLSVGQQASATILFTQGFETDISDWVTPERVASGTNGITSASGSFHAEAAGHDYTLWGGYNFGAGGGVATAFQEYKTSIDIYLDLAGGWASDTRFDFDSAISNSDGNFLRDFVFNGGFYDASDVTGPGAGVDRFVISASNNSSPTSAYPKNPDKDPFAITAGGWYTFEHHFYESGGLLGVDMSILTSGGSLVNQWNLGGDAIGSVGGNRYGWFSDNDFSVLAYDNSNLETMTAVPEPSTALILGLGLLGVGVVRRRRRS